jgi:hypothetical protein
LYEVRLLGGGNKGTDTNLYEQRQCKKNPDDKKKPGRNELYDSNYVEHSDSAVIYN